MYYQILHHEQLHRQSNNSCRFWKKYLYVHQTLNPIIVLKIILCKVDFFKPLLERAATGLHRLFAAMQ